MDRIDLDRDPQAVLDLYRTDPAALRRLVQEDARARQRAQARAVLAGIRRGQRNLSFIARMAAARARDTLFQRIIGSSFIRMP